MILRPTTRYCREKECPELLVKEVDGRRFGTCKLTGKIPGNMRNCPMEREEEWS